MRLISLSVIFGLTLKTDCIALLRIANKLLWKTSLKQGVDFFYVFFFFFFFLFVCCCFFFFFVFFVFFFFVCLVFFFFWFFFFFFLFCTWVSVSEYPFFLFFFSMIYLQPTRTFHLFTTMGENLINFSGLGCPNIWCKTVSWRSDLNFQREMDNIQWRNYVENVFTSLLKRV